MSTYFAFSVDPTTNDFYLDESGTVATVEDGEAVGEHARQRIKSYQGEWFLDTSSGVPWLQDILGRAQNVDLAESIIKATLIETPGVTDISEFSVRFDRVVRSVEPRDIVLQTEFGEVSL